MKKIIKLVVLGIFLMLLTSCSVNIGINTSGVVINPTTTKDNQTTNRPTTAKPGTERTTIVSTTKVPATTKAPATTVAPATTKTEVTTKTVTPGMVVLPDLSGKNRDEITTILNDLGIKFKFSIPNLSYEENDAYLDEINDEVYGIFVKYGSKLEAGQEFDVKKTLTVQTTALNINADYSSKVKMVNEAGQELDDNYIKGKSFVSGNGKEADWIGYVEVVKFVDGDTTWFKDLKSGYTFSLRYLGIDTPESTALFEPWGKSASNYTKTRLSNAYKIVVQGDKTAGFQDNNGRYLGWVWIKDSEDAPYELLNLCLVEKAYSSDKASTGSLYYDYISECGFELMSTKRRVYGELDPNFDYSKDPIALSIADLFTIYNYEDLVGKKVCVKGVVTRMVGQHPYIEDLETGYGIYCYTGYQNVVGVEIGATITLNGVTCGLHEGCRQLTDFLPSKLTVNSYGTEVTPKTITISEVGDRYLGSFVKLENLTIVSRYSNQETLATTITCKDANGKTISIRIDASSVSKFLTTDGDGNKVVATELQKNKVINVWGPLSYYDGSYQLMLCLNTDYEFIN